MFLIFSPKWENEKSAFISDLVDISAISIEKFEDRTVRILSQQEITRFLAYFQKGSRFKQIKCATSYKINVTHKKGHSRYFIHHQSLGPEPGGMIQIVFKPKKPGLIEFLTQLDGFSKIPE